LGGFISEVGVTGNYRRTKENVKESPSGARCKTSAARFRSKNVSGGALEPIKDRTTRKKEKKNLKRTETGCNNIKERVNRILVYSCRNIGKNRQVRKDLTEMHRKEKYGPWGGRKRKVERKAKQLGSTLKKKTFGGSNSGPTTENDKNKTESHGASGTSFGGEGAVRDG